MATTEMRKTVVCDAGPLIHLDELGCIDLLNDFAPVIIPNAVWDEVLRHRPSVLRAPAPHFERRSVTPHAEIDALSALFALHRGEKEALALADEISGALLLTDDTAARLAAKTLEIAVHGSLGILVRAIRRGQRTKFEIVALLRDAPRNSSLHIRRSLLDEIIDEILDAKK